MRDGTLTSVVPSDAATDKYNNILQERLQNSVWTQCASWYRAGAQGRIFSTFPGPLVLLWWWLRKPQWDDFEVEGPGTQQWRRDHGSHANKARAVKITFPLVATLGILALATYRADMDPKDFVDQAVCMWTVFFSTGLATVQRPA